MNAPKMREKLSRVSLTPDAWATDILATGHSGQRPWRHCCITVLVLGWMTVPGFDSRRRNFISVCL